MLLGPPFEWGNSLFAFTTIAIDSTGAAELEAYRLVDPKHFSGGEPDDRNGFLHGEKVTIDGRTFCLQGPPSVFEADPVPIRPVRLKALAPHP